MNVVIPTYKRYNSLKGKDYFKDAKYVLPESQKDDYLKVLDINRMIVIPDECDGSIGKKRNWILKNIEKPLIMVDDDVYCLVYREYGKQKKLDFLGFKRLIYNGFTMADDLGCVLWGINQNTDPINYREFRPISLSTVILGPFQGHLNHNELIDESVGTKDDYDFSIHILNKYRKILRFNKYSYNKDIGVNNGGIVSYRTKEKEEEFCKRIMRKWGSRVIKYNLPPKTMSDLLNGKVSVPIKGQ